jgi:Na+/pantothenate symporter
MFIRTVLKEVQTMTHNLILPHKLQGIAIYLEAFLEMICLCWLSSPTNAIDSSAMKSTRPLKST